MTGTAAVGILAVFLVDALSLLYVSRLGQTALTAAVGYATQILFFPVGINIGMTIAITARTSRALGAGQRETARQIAAAGLVLAGLLGIVVTLIAWLLADRALVAFGAKGEIFDVAQRFLHIALPANVPFALGMAFSGVLRATGDAKRAMYVTLSGGLVTALLDPLLIFGLGLGVYGAAVTVVFSRLALVAVGFHGASRIHGLVGRPRWHGIRCNFVPLITIAVPAIMTNLATPVANSYAVHVFAQFGNPAVAASAIIDRIVPLAYCALFALSGAVGPILGQNLGAGNFARVFETLNRSFQITTVYALAVWLVLALGWPLIVWLFDTNPETARYIAFFCRFGASAWIFIGCLFVANAAFNNLGFPLLSMLFNWSRATLGTIPFVTWGAALAGVEGGQLGIAVGAAIFGLAALASSYLAVRRLLLRPRAALA